MNTMRRMMPQIKTIRMIRPSGTVCDNRDASIDIATFVGRTIKRSSRVGDKIVVHLVGAAPGELLIFSDPCDYERAVERCFQQPSRG
jgi:hypothetical protein